MDDEIRRIELLKFFLDEGLEGESWKRVTKPEYLKDLVESRKKKK